MFKSLTGHTSGVQSLAFSTNEDKIVSGSVSGSLKVWDLEVNKCKLLLTLLLNVGSEIFHFHNLKVICNLIGHKATVTSLEFHAYADYIASGSMDSHIRVIELEPNTFDLLGILNASF
jgi:katanin p80 WD40 repeat-containing subunit B1